MSLVALDGTPLISIGPAGRNGTPSIVALSSVTIDAANEAIIMIGRVVTEDGASHTIDATGASSLGWRSGSVTFANAGTTVKVGLAAVDATTGPPGRAVNVADVITFDVSKTMVGGGGGISSNAWQESVPDAGTKTIANGDLIAFCVQATARAGTDSVLVSSIGNINGVGGLPGVTSFTGGAYADTARLPNATISFSDGALGFFFGGFVASSSSNFQTWNNASSPNEYGNLLMIPFPVKAYGIVAAANVAGDADFVLYSDPLGTPIAQKTCSVDPNTVGTTATGSIYYNPFPAPFTINARTPVAAVLKPTSATSVTMNYKICNAAAHQKSDALGTNGYAVSRSAGAFAAQNSGKDRFAIGLLISAFEHGVQPDFALGI